MIFCLSVGDNSPSTPRWRHRVRVVKELVLKANGLCPREFKSRRCRHTLVVPSLGLPVLFFVCKHQQEESEFEPRGAEGPPQA
jgi:hypothetical protein